MGSTIETPTGSCVDYENGRATDQLNIEVRHGIITRGEAIEVVK